MPGSITVPLIAGQPGVARADIPLASFGPGTHTLFIVDSGDSHYVAGTQSVRITDTHHRTTRH